MPDTPLPRFQIFRHPVFWMIVALALRLAYLMEQQSGSVLFYQPLLDEQEMVTAARQLLAGGGFGREPLFKAPLYPVYLAGVMFVSGEGWFFLARLVQHLLGAGLVLIAYDTARRVSGGPRGRGSLAGALAAGAVALYGPLIRLENSLLLDFFAVLLQSAMLWALVRMRTTPAAANEKKWAALAGTLAALAWLNRPTLTPVLPFLALWVVGGRAAKWKALKWKSVRVGPLRRRLVCAALVLALPIAAMGLVYLRNAAIGGEGLVLPWQGGYSFYYANSLGANGRYYLQESYSLASTGNPTRELAEAGWRRAVAQGKAQPPAGSSREPDFKQGRFHAIDRYWMNRAKEEIRQAPARWAGLMGKKLLYLVNDREIFNFEAYEVHQRMSWVLRWLPVSFGVLWPLALASLALIGTWPHARRGLAGLVWLYAGLLGGAIALYYTSGRLRMPLVFPAAVLAGCGAELALRSGKFKFGVRHAGLLILFLIGVALSWGDWWGVRSESQRHIEYARLSNAAWRAGEYGKALGFAEACERERHGYPSAALLRGQALYSLGRIPEATAAFMESLTRFPDDPVAPFNLGIIFYYDQPVPARAAAMFEEALRRQGNYHAAAWMGALARLRLGELERARRLLNPYLPLKGEAAPERLMIAATALYSTEKKQEEVRRVAGTIERSRGAAGLKRLAEELKTLGLQMP